MMWTTQMLDKLFELANHTWMALKKWLIETGLADSIRNILYFANQEL